MVSELEKTTYFAVFFCFYKKMARVVLNLFLVHKNKINNNNILFRRIFRASLLFIYLLITYSIFFVITFNNEFIMAVI